MSSLIKNIQHGSWDDIFAECGSGADVGSVGYGMRDLAIRVRTTKEIVECLERSASVIQQSSMAIKESLDCATKQNEESSAQILVLNKRLLWLNAIMTVLSVVGVVLAGFQVDAALAKPNETKQSIVTHSSVSAEESLFVSQGVSK